MANHIYEIVDTSKYPIDDTDSINYEKLVANSKETYKRDGIVVLPNFLRDESVTEIVKDLEAIRSTAWDVQTLHNIFYDEGDNSYPSDHIRNRKFLTTVSTLAFDQLDNGLLVNLYKCSELIDFVARVIDKKKLFRLDDPFGAASINVSPPGTYQNWHFDESAFSVTIMLKKAEVGGEFQLTPCIRDSEHVDEELLETVEKVVGEETDLAKPLLFEPGTLSIFCGSKSLHQVTENKGTDDRLVAVLCFAEQTGVKNSARVQELFWGRTAS